ncbi:MAG: hypothetical protein JNL97_00490 [Verrucomicrobiales bacterium]|nr:hypothetical protein [Verrucomicrobiales bacterium]
MNTPRCLVLLAALTLESCRYPGEFRNAPEASAQAVVRGTKSPNGGAAFATHIDGGPTSFWRLDDNFRLPAGTHTCRTAFSDRRETVSYAPMRFVAEAGKDYVLVRTRDPDVADAFTATQHPTTPDAWIVLDRRDRMRIRESGSQDSGPVIAEASREDFVFGVSSAEGAIARYRLLNP